MSVSGNLVSEAHKPGWSLCHDMWTFDNFYSGYQLLLPASLVFGSQCLYFSLETPPTLVACILSGAINFISQPPLPQIGCKTRMVNTCKLFSAMWWWVPEWACEPGRAKKSTQVMVNTLFLLLSQSVYESWATKGEQCWGYMYREK